jgi:exodeoxyribonuclease-1
MTMHYVFYDTETTGTLTAYDQILQFGAIRTDENLIEFERFDIRCRLMPHVVPAPKALEVTGVTPDMLTDASLPSHYEAMRRIHDQLTAWSPAVFIGFNSLAFDEALLRHASTSVYAPNVITVPIGDNERPVYRLDRLAPANGFNHADAHEAMADVAATIHMAKLVKDRAPAVWDAMMARTRKQDVSDFLFDQPIVCLTEFWGARPYSRLVTACGSNPSYDAEHAVFDLSFAPEDYLHMSVDALVDVLRSRTKPIRIIRANAQPILMPFESAPPHLLDAETSVDEIERRAAAVGHDIDFKRRVGQALTRRYPEREPSPHIEEKIYDGFASASDQHLMAQFHSTGWEGRAELADKLNDHRMKQLAYRLIYLEHPELLPQSMRPSFDERIAERLLSDDPNVPWRTLPKAMQETDDLMSTGTDEEQRIFYQQVRHFLEQQEEAARAI